MTRMGTSAVVTVLWGEESPADTIQRNGVYTHGVTESSTWTGSIRCRLVLIHATHQHNDLINRYRTPRLRGRELKAKAQLENSSLRSISGSKGAR